jgi:hypothetical protein
MRTAIIYHYYELDETYRDNLIYFLDCGIDEHAEYFIYISGKCSADLPKRKNIKYLFIKNENNDFGSVIEFSKTQNYQDFDNFVFVNCSVRGPFTPTYFSEPWHHAFTSKLVNDVAMVGSSINLLPEHMPSSIKFSRNKQYKPPFIHVQTYAYAITSQGFDLLKLKGFFDVKGTLSKEQVIQNYEIAISQELLGQGFAIASLLQTQEYFTDDSRTSNYITTAASGDPAFRSAFFGRSISPFDNIFIKTNRNMISNVDLASYTFSGLEHARRSKPVSAQGMKLLERSHSFVIQHGNKFVITINDLTQVLSDVKSCNPTLASQLRCLL